ncbi:probable leucine-rich repeat receptor-like protein kinase At1g35710 [Juglans microcarpa x Juglans regia]|uniref:probable leucine-rich repeat receptor-like protein kinase At1g35710 n=1 Tax=Juglans microcarpa x Juglans regia TaxID=2249226 RepID=UPI001B7F6952|nr:probable leucine-rich repeat receptor-like protein kinase At1g35710 [Juglans microcarpa x Juglans regia]
MASISASTLLLIFSLDFTLSPVILSASVVEDLTKLQPPPDFNSTIMTNCFNNPSLRYCNSSPMDLTEIFRSTIVASHLCNESKNPNCAESFPKIDLRSRPKVAPLYLSFSFFWKYCPLTILLIDLSNNSLKGSFPIDVLNCTQIQALDLSHNKLSGDVPVQSFSSLTNLTVFNLSYNHFSESKMSDTEFFKRFNASSFLHSGLLPDRKKFTMKAVFLLVCFPILVIVTVGCFGCLCLRRPDFLPRMFRRKNKFTPPMLKAATGGFSRKNLVGTSAGVDIYRGVLRDGTEVRIEIYWDDISRESRRRFIEECKVVTQLCHKNILQVLGWCNSRRMRAIVTEWMEGKNVEIWISESAPPWKQRLKILMGVVNGMCYLQEEWPEVGYDLRTSSVLLSDDLEPLISRFKLGDQSCSSRKIYEFGLFLLEILVNKIPSDHEFQSGENGFIDHVRMHYPRNLQKVIDEKIKMTERIFDQAKKVIGLGLMCTDQSGSHHHLQLGQISDIITRAYESWDVLDSPVQNRSHVDRGKGHKHI